MTTKALSHLKVLDLTHIIAGPYCTKLMAGFGAEVIKIERPIAGDELRSFGPFYNDEPGLERSIPFLWLNTGKKSITLNLKTKKGKEIFDKLLYDADIIVENFSPGVMEQLGISYDVLKNKKPDIIMTSISNFGQTGPYRDYKATEIVEYAMSGLMYATGDVDRAPLASGPAITQYTAGQTAYLACLIALYRLGATGQGEHVDVSIQECAMDLGELMFMKYLSFGTIAKRNSDRHMLCPWQSYPCRDGYTVFIGGPPRNWHQVSELVEEPILAHKKFNRMGSRLRKRHQIESIIKPWLKTKTKEEIFHAAQARGLAFGYVANLDEVLASPIHRERNFFKEVTHPVAGTHQYCGAPYHSSDNAWNTTRAPLLGEHNEAIYCSRLGYSTEELSEMMEGGVI